MGYTKEQRAAKINTTTEKKVEIKIKNLPLTTTIWVYSNRYGELNYISANTGFSAKWGEFRSKLAISLEELIKMRNTQKSFFEKNWILLSTFTDIEYQDLFSVEEILDYLQVRQYYSDVLCPENIEEIFDFSVDEIEKRVSNMSSGVKSAISIRANELIESGKLDSLSKIKAFEKALECELIRA